jgi:hypothetical protein
MRDLRRRASSAPRFAAARGLGKRADRPSIRALACWSGGAPDVSSTGGRPLALQLFVVPLPIHRAIVFGGSAIAVWRGEWRTRLVGAALGIGFGFDQLVHFHWTSANIPLGGLRFIAEDLVFLGVCLFCVHRARSYWVIWASAIAVLAVACDALFMTTGQISARTITAPWQISLRTFVSASRVWNYALSATLIWAALVPDHAARASQRLDGREGGQQ